MLVVWALPSVSMMRSVVFVSARMLSVMFVVAFVLTVSGMMVMSLGSMKVTALDTSCTLHETHGLPPSPRDTIFAVRASRHPRNQLVKLFQCLLCLLIQRRRSVLHPRNAFFERTQVELVRYLERFGDTGDLLQVAGELERVLGNVEGEDDVVCNPEGHQTKYLCGGNLRHSVSRWIGPLEY